MLLALFFFNWRIIVLQCYVGFFCTTWISYKCLYIYIHTRVCVCVCIYIYVLCCAESLSRVWLCDPVDCNPRLLCPWGFSRQEHTEWAAMPSSRESSQPRDGMQVTHIAGGFFTIWATRAAQDHWSGQPVPSPWGLPDPGIKQWSPILHVNSLPAELPGKPEYIYICIYTGLSLPLEPSSHSPHLTPLGHHKAPGWAPYVILCF